MSWWVVLWARKVFNEISVLKKYWFGNRDGRELEGNNIFGFTVMGAINYPENVEILFKIGI